MVTESTAVELCEIVGEDVMARICERFGGQRIYIPHRVPNPDRDSAVCQTFNTVIHESSTVGNAYQRVGSAHNISARTVRRIICDD